MSGRSDTTSNFSTSSTATSRLPWPKPMTMRRAKAYAKMGRIAARLQAKTAKRTAGPPRETELGDPMREGEAGLESECLEANEKFRLQAPQSVEKPRSTEDKCLDFLPVLL